MKQNDLHRMLSLVDEKYIDELTGSVSCTSRTDPVPQEVTGTQAWKRSAPWRSLTAIAAAVVLLVPCGLLAKQAWENRTPVQDPIQPQTVMTETIPSELPGETPRIADEDSESQKPFGSLSDANAADYPWQGKVIQAEQIGAMKFDGAFRCRLHYPNHAELRDAVHVVYKDEAAQDEHYAHVQYTRAAVSELTNDPDTAIRMEALCTTLIGSSQMQDPEETGGNTTFVVNCGNYRISVVMRGCTRQELAELIEAVSNGLHGIAPDAISDGTLA